MPASVTHFCCLFQMICFCCLLLLPTLDVCFVVCFACVLMWPLDAACFGYLLLSPALPELQQVLAGSGQCSHSNRLHVSVSTAVQQAYPDLTYLISIHSKNNSATKTLVVALMICCSELKQTLGSCGQDSLASCQHGML